MERHDADVMPGSRRSLLLAVMIVIALVATLGAARPGDAAGPGTTSEPGELHTETVRAPDGRLRSYHVYVPSSAGDEPLPLLIALHGGTGWGLQFRSNSDLDALAESEGFLVAYPDGTPILRRGDSRVWNGGECCGRAVDSRRNVDDVGFIDAMIDEITADHAVDEGRIYATGHSNGAIMSYRLACELSDRVAAVAFQAGSLEIDTCAPGEPVAVMAIHGTADPSLPIDGGTGSGISGHDFFSPRLSIETLADVNGCASVAESADPTNPDVTRHTWTGCNDGVVVQFVEVEGANHAWMGHRGTLFQLLVTGRPYMDLDSSAESWAFVSQFDRS